MRKKNIIINCGRCTGAGHELVYKKIFCYNCHGSGQNLRSTAWAEKCKICYGDGTMYGLVRSTEPCSACHGKGSIEY